MKPVPNFRFPLFGTSSPSLLNSAANAPVKSTRRPLLIWVAAAGLFGSSQAAAQEYALLNSTPKLVATPEAATKAFWKMTTNPGNDSTLVGFYTPGNTLMYEEKLPNRAVKLTKQNLRKLNEMTERLTAANGSTVAANTLSEAMMGRTASRVGTLQMGTYASRDGIHLHVMLENPARDYVVIELLSKSGNTVYSTSTRLDKAHYKLNLEGMPGGDYRLRVLGKKQLFERTMSFSSPKPDPNFPTLRVAIN